MGTYNNEIEQFIYTVFYRPMWEAAYTYIAEHPYALNLSYSRIQNPDSAMLEDMILEFTKNIRIDEDSLLFDAVVSCTINLTEDTYKGTASHETSQWLVLSCVAVVTEYHNEELKSLTRYRFDKVRERAKLKTSVARLVCILFPELERLVPTLHMASVYALLSEFSGAQQVAAAHLTHLKSVLSNASKGRYGQEKAAQIRDAARNSIGFRMPAKSLELKHTIQLIRELNAEIEEIEKEINSIMDEIHSPITTIPGIGSRMVAMILAEIGDFSHFDSADKILAYAGMAPSTYQSGQLTNCYSHMEKRGSKYLRYAIFNATKYVCNWDSTFAAYLAKKRAEGKHYNVAISHAAKKLVRLIYAMEKSQQPYRPAL